MANLRTVQANAPRTSMARLTATLLLGSLMTLTLAACAGKKAVQTPQELTAAANEGGPWFCQPDPSLEAWDCDNDPAKVANPVPDRRPTPSLGERPPEAGLLAPAEVTAAAGWQAAADTLLALPADHYTIQLTTMSAATDVSRYLETLATPSLSAAQIEQNGTLLYVLLFGTYANLERALATSEELPEQLAQFEPKVRPLGPLQAAILRGQELQPVAP